jgi:hypothetical protein
VVERRDSELPEHQTAEKLSRFLQAFLKDKVSEGPGSPMALSRAALECGVECRERTYLRTVLLNRYLRHACGMDGSGNAPLHASFPVPAPINFPALDHQRALHACRPHGVLTPNYDPLIEHAFCRFGEPSAVRVYRYSAQFLPLIHTNPSYILKLHGDINDIGTMLFDPEAAWEADGALAGRAGADLKDVYADVCSKEHLVFVGAGMRDRTVLELHKAWRCDERSRAATLRRIAFVPEGEVRSIRSELAGRTVAETLFDDVEFCTFTPGEDRGSSEVRAILDAIALARAI